MYKKFGLIAALLGAFIFSAVIGFIFSLFNITPMKITFYVLSGAFLFTVIVFIVLGIIASSKKDKTDK